VRCAGVDVETSHAISGFDGLVIDESGVGMHWFRDMDFRRLAPTSRACYTVVRMRTATPIEDAKRKRGNGT
jgi:hypothetical protein